MSDISIPGLTSGKYKSSEIVKGLVEAESTRLESMETTLESLEEEQKHWQEINRRTGRNPLKSNSKSVR